LGWNNSIIQEDATCELFSMKRRKKRKRKRKKTIWPLFSRFLLVEIRKRMDVKKVKE